MPLLEAHHLSKVFNPRSTHPVNALKDVNLTIDQGEFVAVMGESGSGKTTLLNILAALDQASGGTVRLADHDLGRLPEAQAAKFRRERLGFIFQNYNLLDSFTVQDNILLPLVLSQVDAPTMTQRLAPLARQLGIEDLLRRHPYELSGGQKQRVAIARALITKPALILADEPTGALDSKNATALLKNLRTINQQGQTILLVTHSAQAASYASRTLFLKDGRIVHQLFRGNEPQPAYAQSISDCLTVLINGEVTSHADH